MSRRIVLPLWCLWIGLVVGGVAVGSAAGAEEAVPSAEQEKLALDRNEILASADDAQEEPLFDGDGVLESGEDDEAELVRAAQNPVADLISVPLQNNTNFEAGSGGHTQNVLNIQPVVPFNLTEDWNLITRTILPVINQPPLWSGGDRECGLGDVNLTMFLSPVNSGDFLWGFGPSFEFPTATDDVLGTEKWSAGPSFVGLTMQGPWVFGALVRQVWSYAGDGDRPSVNQMLVQPFINYNLPENWYLTCSPIITANWQADSDNQWTIPIGGGIGKLMFLGKLPVNVSCQAYHNVESPRGGADWTLRLQVQFLFPKPGSSQSE